MTDAPSTPPSPSQTPAPSALPPTLLEQTAPPPSETPSTTTPPSSETPPKPEPSLLDPAKGPEGAPEAYADFALPEGFALPDELKTEVTGLFKEAGLTQDQAQKFIDAHVKQVKAATEAPAQAFMELRRTWQQEAFKDPNIGTGTQVKPEVLSNIGRAIDSLGALAPAFRAAMNLTGVGDNPAFIAAFNQFAQAINEGRPVKAGAPAAQQNPSQPQSKAHALYPNLP